MSDPVVKAIEVSLEERGYPPSLRELSTNLGMSIGWVHQRLRQLEQAGVLVREAGRPRAMRIVKEKT